MLELQLDGIKADLLHTLICGFRNLTAAGASYFCDQDWATFFQSVNPGLRHVDLLARIPNSALMIMASRCRELQTLKGNFPDLMDDVLDMIAQGCPELSVVSIPLSSHVTADGITALAQARKLTELSICTPLSAAAILQCPQLRHLCVWNTCNMTNILRALCEACFQLTSLTLRSDNAVPCNEVVSLVQACPSLQELSLNTVPTDALLCAFGEHCHHLTGLKLNFSASAVTDAGICALAQGCPRLLCLEDHLVAPVSMVGITALATHCPRLRNVWVMKPVAGAGQSASIQVNKLCVHVRGNALNW
jgi:hypothetical protein